VRRFTGFLLAHGLTHGSVAKINGASAAFLSEPDASRRERALGLDLNGQINYQGKLKTQFPLGEHRVAYTGRGEIVTAARITNPYAVVDHALYWAAFDSPDEALYVVGVINTQALHTRIVDALSKGLFGGRNIHRAPFLIAWPQFDPEETLHRRIVELAEHAEEVAATAGGQTGRIAGARKLVRAALQADGVSQQLEEIVEELLTHAGAGKQLETA
jgi:hypothetical protein